MWPKKIPELNEEQKKIREDFMRYWHEILPARYSIMEKFNHEWGVNRSGIENGCKTLEIGAGIGAHIAFEDISTQDYCALELRPEMAREIIKKYPEVRVTVGDIQGQLDFPSGSFDRIVSIHVLEHLPDLPRALNEIKRILKPKGFCDFVLPCEGSIAYSIARKISAERIFKKRYRTSYNWFIKSEHINSFPEIMDELKSSGFKTEWRKFFPIPLPFYWMNLAVGLRCRLN